MKDQALDDSALTTKVMTLINSLDPHGFFAGEFGVPYTEYLAEAEAIAEVVRSGRALDVNSVDEIWVHWFSQPLTELKPLEDVQAFIAQVNDCAEER